VFGSRPAFDWRTSSAHLLLLSDYARGPASADAHSRNPHWAEVLGEPLPSAIQQLLAEGALMPCDLGEHLDRKFTVARLKGLLKAHGTGPAGRKADLIDALMLPAELFGYSTA